MILAGDIGGTKTVLALYRSEDPIGRPYRLEKYVSADHGGLEPIVAEFLCANEVPRVAAFGIAGPVLGRSVSATNLPWVVDAARLEGRFEIRQVDLLNDLQATALAVPFLGPEDVCTLHAGSADPGGTIAVVAPGTGLGVAFLVPTEQGHRAFPSEGGHMSFAPCSAVESELLRFLRARFGHVSYERISSGSGLPNIYDYFLSSGQYLEPAWLQSDLSAARDRTPIIVNAALEQRADICTATLDLFVQVLAGAVGNVELLLMATGGLYLGGGIPPKILDRLKQPDFLNLIHSKGRSRALLQRMPVHVILDPQAALHGAVWHARRRDAELLSQDAAR
jgi:glucokinase